MPHVCLPTRCVARAVAAFASAVLVIGLSASSASAAPHKKTPTPTITARPAAQTNARSATFEFADSLAGATFTCSLDNRTFAACTSPKTYAGPLAAGSHSFRVRAKAANHTVSSAARATWLIDLVAPPAPTLSGIPSPSPTAQTGATLTFSDAQAAVTFLCSLDGATAAPCTSPVSLTGLADGPHSFAVSAHDVAGNVSSAASGSWTVDGTPPPVPTITTGPANPTNQSAATFAVGDDDPTATITCSLDGAAYAACGPTASYTSLTPGTHTFDLRASDEVGNHSDAAQFSWTVDLTAPTPPSIDSGPAAVTNNPVGAFTFTLPAGAAQLRCSLDGAPYATCTSPYTTPSLTDGAHTLLVLARDAASNDSGATPYHWTVDTVAPTSTLVTSTALTNIVTATFSEPVKRVSTSSLQLRVANTTAGRPASVACRTADSLAVSCSTGPVKTATLRINSPLIPGQRYVAVVNPAGAASITDPAGNPVPRTSKALRALRQIQETSVALTYAWRAVHAAAAFGGVYRTAHTAGASVSRTFTGVGITWYAVTGPSQGLANVYVDGVKKTTVNNYAAAKAYKVARSVTGLTNSKHTLRIVVAGRKGNASGTGTYVSVDAVKVTGHAVVANPALATKWRFSAVKAASGGGVALADLAGDTVSMRFRGTSIAWYTSTGRNRGIAKVYVDGHLRATYDLYAATTTYGVRRAIGALTNTVHSVKIVVTGTHRAKASGSVIVFDRWLVG